MMLKEMPHISVEEGAALLLQPEPPVFLDVREAWELEIVKLSNAIHFPLPQFAQSLPKLDKEKPVIVFCHHGGRSARATAILLENGFNNVKNLSGGIDAWALKIDPSMERY